MKYPAEYLVIFGGQKTYACEKHKNGIKTIAEIMSASAVIKKDKSGKECKNCINENTLEEKGEK